MVAASWHVAGAPQLSEISDQLSPWYVAPTLRDAYLSYATDASRFSTRCRGLDVLENHQHVASSLIKQEHWWGEATSSGGWRDYRLSLSDIEAVCASHGVSARGIWAHFSALQQAAADVKVSSANESMEQLRIIESTCSCCQEHDEESVSLRTGQQIRALNGFRLCDSCVAAITAQVGAAKAKQAAAWLSTH